jgi:hypothetical protein
MTFEIEPRFAVECVCRHAICVRLRGRVALVTSRGQRGDRGVVDSGTNFGRAGGAPTCTSSWRRQNEADDQLPNDLPVGSLPRDALSDSGDENGARFPLRRTRKLTHPARHCELSHSSLVPHDSSLTTHHSPLTTHHSPLISATLLFQNSPTFETAAGGPLAAFQNAARYEPARENSQESSGGRNKPTTDCRLPCI